ncbi:hypothetical protein [uncultured Halomonas sp.]|uniref:hypothetical protein n=1 Tax=uncultured Halomonas sp. TaxID=173971 RepID=UPI00259734FA|nr:hypothetical protein [uncultured Halomonas sp.]
MVTVLSASAVPVSVGVASSVLSPLESGPDTLPTLSEAVVMAGTTGALVSTLRSKAVLGSEVLPAASVAVAVKLWLPSPRSVAGV